MLRVYGFKTTKRDDETVNETFIPIDTIQDYKIYRRPDIYLQYKACLHFLKLIILIKFNYRN